MSSSWIQHLNEAQKAAALHNEGPLLILAGAGSGKTTVLVSRTGRLIDEEVVQAQQLCVLTFTNKAARELKSRVVTQLGPRAKGVWAGTFHSFGLQILKSHHEQFGLPKQFEVIDPSYSGSLLKELLVSFHQGDKSAYDADRLLSTLTLFREEGRTARKTDNEYEVAVEWLLPKYSNRLKQLGLVDFDDLLLKPLELLETSSEIQNALLEKFKQVMVDEFQDTNKIQMRLVRALTQRHNNLTVVGDDDQSIYGWRGACIQNILSFPKLYSNCKVVRLEENYRSTSSIIKVANAVIQKNTERHSKVLKPTKADPGPHPEVLVFSNENEEAEGIATDISLQLSRGFKAQDIAVLFRSNSQGALIEAELRRMGHPYSLTGGTGFFDRREIRDILAYLKCAVKPNEVPLRRILNTPHRGIGDKSFELLDSYMKLTQCNFYQSMVDWRKAGLETKTGTHIDELINQLKALPQALVGTLGETPGQALISFLNRIRYKSHLEKTSSQSLAAQKRWKNIEVFADIFNRIVTKDSTLSGIKNFLESMDLRDVPDDEEKKDVVQLLTLHACKGLEFPLVYFAGVEEDIIPHKRLGSDVAEERRLFYVGVTRAKQKLIFTRSRKRKKHGKDQASPPSRFLLELPEELYVEHIGGRPSEASGRKALLSQLYKKLDGLGV